MYQKNKKSKKRIMEQIEKRKMYIIYE
uniref:Uncharacterized protein n=1 Tax=Lepeophtheirus salmonis TaxID=72036 RepID=A0A0K2T1W0_LEPSM